MLIALLNVLQICPKHFEYNFGITSEQERVLGNKEIAALIAQSRNFDAAPTGGELSVLYNNALMARRREAILDKIWEGTFQIENRRTFLHHTQDCITAVFLIPFR